MRDGEYADSLAKALYRCTQLEIETGHLKRENARLREALDKCIKAMEFTDDYFDGPVAVVQDAKDAIRAAAAAIWEADKNGCIL